MFLGDAPPPPGPPGGESAPAVSEETSGSAPVGPDGVIRSGWMTKRGRVRKNWKRRWFVLRADGTLTYYASEASKAPLGSLNLQTLVAVESLPHRESRGKSEPIFQVKTKNRVLALTTETTGAANNWIDAFRKFLNFGFINNE